MADSNCAEEEKFVLSRGPQCILAPSHAACIEALRRNKRNQRHAARAAQMAHASQGDKPVWAR